MMAGHENREINKKIWKKTNGKPAKLLNYIIKGQTLQQIADSMGVTKQAVHQYLLRLDDDAYHKAREIAADAIAADLVGVASSGEIDAARARNMINVGQFILERRYKTYQQKQAVDVTVNNIADRLQAGRQRMADVIDIEPVDGSGTDEPE